jgi:hypothetical protein
MRTRRWRRGRKGGGDDGMHVDVCEYVLCCIVAHGIGKDEEHGRR